MTIQEAILQLPLRADKNDDNKLVSTFVQVGALMPLLLSANNHILYGRRGTGKTHVLKYLKSKVEAQGNIGIYIDMRAIGSSKSIYSDSSIPLSQRTLRLLSDVIKEIHDGILHSLSSRCDMNDLLSFVAADLSRLTLFVDEEYVNGEYTIDTTSSLEGIHSRQGAFSVSLPSFATMSADESVSKKKGVSESFSGKREAYIDYQAVFAILNDITKAISPRKIWVFIDEFSEVAQEMQVFLADMFKRVFLPNNGIVFKIAAIEHHCRLSQYNQDGSHMGLEAGAEISSCSLDDFLVFGNNRAQACMFYRELLLCHINSMLLPENRLKDSDELIRTLFTQENAFLELVLAAEGVPRDAFYILVNAITIDYSSKISIPTLRKAARQWYINDKQKNVDAYPGAFLFLSWIIDVVINKRHARAFLLKSGCKVDLIKYLFDSRILHIIKQSVSGRDIPGERYDVYSIDYGCYCDLINTAKQPKGLFEAIEEEEEIFVEVPKDDYRSIRRAILNLDDCPYLTANSL